MIEPMSVELLEEALAALATAMMTAPSGRRVGVGFAWAVDALAPLMRRYFPTEDEPSFIRQLGDLLRFECEWSGVVLRGRLEDRQWRETIDLYPACLLERGVEQVDKLMKRALGLRRNTRELAAAAEIVGLVGRFLTTLRPFAYRLSEPQASMYETLRARALGIFVAKGAAKIAETTRIAAAEALGRAGDPRLRAECFHERMIAVPGTRIRMAKYPVTVEEFERFVLSGGYDQYALWDEDGWAFRKRHNWTEPVAWDNQLTTPNRPVINVSWFAAAAYCRWLCTQDWKVRLPTCQFSAAFPPSGASFSPPFPPGRGRDSHHHSPLVR
jgi:hypothetical protein